ncbi:hypothetical protein EGW08_019925 [Elysia chlorotica]|uniref:Uncharacterized protein n=1 Tax=Elysia chlorotica TaxID=188477 RepID=A0A3S1AZJ4_ELYCH|nr:hypothetical protein EGW08_019925 [Elysia chlorotica]
MDQMFSQKPVTVTDYIELGGIPELDNEESGCNLDEVFGYTANEQGENGDILLKDVGENVAPNSASVTSPLLQSSSPEAEVKEEKSGTLQRADKSRPTIKRRKALPHIGLEKI